MRPDPVPARRDAGFTLIEALVALAILAIAASALLGAAGAGLDRVGRLEAVTFARMVADNRLSELRLASVRPVSGQERVAMAGKIWQVDISARATRDDGLTQVVIGVAEAGTSHVAFELTGFIDAEAQ